MSKLHSPINKRSEIVGELLAAGFKQQASGHYVNRKRGVSVSFGEGSSLWYKLRSNTGGYGSQKSLPRTPDGLKQLLELRGEQTITKSEHIPARTFQAGAVTCVDGLIWRVHSIYACTVVRVVTISGSRKLGSAYDVPDSKPWLRLLCYGRANQLFHIISDGDEWYPLSDAGCITTNLKPRTGVDLNNMTALDQQLVKMAIEDYFSNVAA